MPSSALNPVAPSAQAAHYDDALAAPERHASRTGARAQVRARLVLACMGPMMHAWVLTGSPAMQSSRHC